MRNYVAIKEGRTVNSKVIILLILLGIVILFTLQNTQVVELRLLFWTVSMSRALMIFIVLAIGIILGMLMCNISRRKHK